MKYILPRFKQFFVALLIVMTIIGGRMCFSTSTSNADTTDNGQNNGQYDEFISRMKPKKKRGVFLMYRTEDGGLGCREASPEEAEKLTTVDPNLVLRPISPPRAEAADGLTIMLMGTPQLDSFPQAKAAFIKAAAAWEAIIRNPITVVVNVDFGPNRFGQPFPPGVIGSTSSQELQFNRGYGDVRNALVQGAQSATETSRYSSLPNSTLPTDIGAADTMFISSANARALGLLPPVATPSSEGNLGPIPAIGFNSAFGFDFDPADGISPGRTDFDGTVVHEIGHLLGFLSSAGDRELIPSLPIAPTPWDIYRFRPGTTSTGFSTANRILSSGGEQVFFNGGPEIRLSTGRFNGTGGDGQQSSHWKSSNFSTRIGIMAPTLAGGERAAINNNDITALDFFGYQLKTGGPSNDTTKPTVKVNTPAVNETVVATTQVQINFTSTDNAAVVSHDIALSLDGGVTYSIDIAKGLAGNVQSFLWTVPQVDTKTARIRVTATDSNSNVGMDETDNNFTIARGGFALTLNQNSQTVSAGSPASFTVGARAIGSFNAPINLSATVSPDNSGATANFSSPTLSIGGNSTLMVATQQTSPAGDVSIRITGTSGDAVISINATVKVVAAVISDFMIAATPSNQTVTAGRATTFNISTTPLNGFTLPISLTAASSDPNVGVAFSSNPTLPGNTVTMTAVAAASSPSTTATVTITGTSGSLVRTAVVTVNVVSPDFALSFNPASVTVARGQVGTITVNIDRLNGFDGNVTVTAPDFKAFKGKLTSPGTQQSTGNSLSFAFKLKKKAPVGAQQLTFSATDSSGRVRTGSVTLNIQ